LQYTQFDSKFDIVVRGEILTAKLGMGTLVNKAGVAKSKIQPSAAKMIGFF
jgi:hypothetical protein